MSRQQYVGWRIQSARYLANLSQKRLSEQTGISTRLISQIENGFDHPRKDLVRQLCDALGVEYGDGK